MLTGISFLDENIALRAGYESLEFSNGINLLCGPNGTGKSTVLKAIRDFAVQGGMRQRLLDVYLEDPRYPPPVLYFAADEVPRSEKTTGSNLRELGVYHKSHGELLSEHLFNIRHQEVPAVFLLDEAETALDLEKLMEFKNIMLEKAQKGHQFIIASHHPLFLILRGVKIHCFGQDEDYVKRVIRTYKKILS